jgi:hypothetical protein
MIKSVSEVFKEQFWRELTVRHAAHDKKPSIEVEDAVVLHLSAQPWRDYAAYEKGSQNQRGYGKTLRKR